jgi:hypothetical protein
MADEYRHQLDEAQRRLSDAQLVATLPEGVGVSVFRMFCWDVVRRRSSTRQRDEYIVTDSSGAGKPQRVFGPVDKRSEAEGWVRVSAEIYRMTKCQQPTWPWE